MNCSIVYWRGLRPRCAALAPGMALVSARSNGIRRWYDAGRRTRGSGTGRGNLARSAVRWGQPLRVALFGEQPFGKVHALFQLAEPPLHVLEFAEPAAQLFDLAQPGLEVTDHLSQVAPGDLATGPGESTLAGEQSFRGPSEGAGQDDEAHADR